MKDLEIRPVDTMEHANLVATSLSVFLAGWMEIFYITIKRYEIYFKVLFSHLATIEGN